MPLPESAILTMQRTAARQRLHSAAGRDAKEVKAAGFAFLNVNLELNERLAQSYRFRHSPKCHRFVSVPPLTKGKGCG
jgi:hypothetical protein